MNNFYLKERAGSSKIKDLLHRVLFKIALMPSIVRVSFVDACISVDEQRFYISKLEVRQKALIKMLLDDEMYQRFLSHDDAIDEKERVMCATSYFCIQKQRPLMGAFTKESIESAYDTQKKTAYLNAHTPLLVDFNVQDVVKQTAAINQRSPVPLFDGSESIFHCVGKGRLRSDSFHVIKTGQLTPDPVVISPTSIMREFTPSSNRSATATPMSSYLSNLSLWGAPSRSYTPLNTDAKDDSDNYDQYVSTV